MRVWRHSYDGLVPDDFLAALSVPRSAEMWAGILDNKEAAVFVAESSAAASTNPTGASARIAASPRSQPIIVRSLRAEALTRC